MFQIFKMPKRHLAIDVNNDTIRFVEMNEAAVNQEHLFSFSDKQDYRYKQQLEEFWNKTGWKESVFDEVTLSWSGFQSTLVPVNVFNESDKESIFELSYGNQITSNEIDYNRLPLQGIVNIYAIPNWIKSFFVIRFPRIVVQHEGTHLIRGVFSGTTFKLKTVLIIHEKYFRMLVVKENQLKFYSQFECSTLEDVVYYYSFAMQQLALNQATNELIISNDADSTINGNELRQTLEKNSFKGSFYSPHSTFG